jgi:hypothetical protein
MPAWRSGHKPAAVVVADSGKVTSFRTHNYKQLIFFKKFGPSATNCTFREKRSLKNINCSDLPGISLQGFRRLFVVPIRVRNALFSIYKSRFVPVKKAQTTNAFSSCIMPWVQFVMPWLFSSIPEKHNGLFCCLGFYTALLKQTQQTRKAYS